MLSYLTLMVTPRVVLGSASCPEGLGFLAPQARTCPRRELLNEADDSSFGNFHLFRRLIAQTRHTLLPKVAEPTRPVRGSDTAG
jgi:hypothetical protein